MLIPMTMTPVRLLFIFIVTLLLSLCYCQNLMSIIITAIMSISLTLYSYIQSMFFLVGAANGFFRGEITGLLDDMQCLKPDVFPCVPRLANKIYDKVKV